jgi:hypothetical protein
MASALAPLRARIPRAIVEREILRVVARIPDNEGAGSFERAREEILKWAARRAGQPLPKEAWEGATFEVLAAGRTTLGVRVNTEGSSIWSIRGDDPDKAMPGRVWSTEVTLGQKMNKEILLGVRLLVNSAEEHLNIVPSVPGLVLQLADHCGLCDAEFFISSSPHFVNDDSDVRKLIEWLANTSRKLPIILASGDERSAHPDQPLVDAHELAKGLCGLAHIVVIPAHLTYLLSDAFGKSLSTFYGAVRICYPGFSHLAEPQGHRLYLSRNIETNPTLAGADIRTAIARDSLRRTRLGQDVVPFATIRSAALRIEQEQQAESGATESEQLQAANRRNIALEEENKILRVEVDQSFDLAQEESDRAETSERQLQGAWARIERLYEALKSRGDGDEGEIEDPVDWDSFSSWCETNFSGRLALSPSARKGLKKPDFEDVALTAKCIGWLASDARDRFMNGGGTIANITIFDGVLNAPCGSDEYDFDFQGRRLQASWHVKNGGNTRQPERCLRIYYAFDDVSQQIIVSDMPAHKRTAAS